ncbi:MAG: RDD family protein [Verrucomicrobiota bacterium]
MRRKANGLKRLFAFLIDIIPIWLLSLIAYKWITGESPFPKESWMALTPGRIFVRDGWLLIWIIYCSIAECTPLRGTLGKRAMGIEVRGPHRGAISFGRALGRNLGKIVSALPLYLGFIWAFFSKSSNAWHDTFAKCGVYERR